MAYTNIIIKAYDLVDELKQSFHYQELRRLDKVIKTKYKKELKEYLETFKTFNEVYNTGGTYHPDFKKASKEYRLKKEVLFKKEEVIDYFKYESLINAYLKELSDEIVSSVSNYSNLEGGVCSWI